MTVGTCRLTKLRTGEGIPRVAHLRCAGSVEERHKQRIRNVGGTAEAFADIIFLFHAQLARAVHDLIARLR